MRGRALLGASTQQSMQQSAQLHTLSTLHSAGCVVVVRGEDILSTLTDFAYSTVTHFYSDAIRSCSSNATVK